MFEKEKGEEGMILKRFSVLVALKVKRCPQKNISNKQN